MRKNLYGLLLLLFFLLQNGPCFASHIFGGELLYTHISGNTYKISLTVYGDCSADASIFATLYTATPIVEVRNNATLFDTLHLAVEESGTEVSPVCPSQLVNTKCNGGTLPGVRRFTYSGTVTLPLRSAGWQFIFTGQMNLLTKTAAGRSSHITNVMYQTASTGAPNLMQIEADLDNSTEDNSSPVYSSIPTPFYCINVDQQYNQGAIDPDGDSIAFSLVPAVDANANGADVTYVPPFTGSNPLATNSGAFYFNALNGQVSFTPNVTQQALVVCKVFEFRKGVLVGTSEREMTFVVLSECPGTPPASVIGTISGGSITGKNVVNICVGTPHLSLDIQLTNPDGDNTTLSNSSLPGSATLTITNNTTPAPSASFDWETGSMPPGIYTFYLSIFNDHCPISSRQTVAYTINITPVPQLSAHVVTPTQCIHKAVVEYDLKYGYTPRTITIQNGGYTYKTYQDTTGTVTDSLPAGTYTIIASSDPLCTISQSIVIPDSGKLPLSPVTKDYCINVPEGPIDIAPVGAGAVITWYFTNGATMYYPPIPNTKKLGSESWYFTEDYQFCSSDKIPVTAIVHPVPTPEILSASKPETICLGDTIYLEASGGVTYTWTPKNEIFKNDSGKLYIRVLTPVTLQLNVVDQYGCKDSTTISYKDIQFCCTFSYPNAFTPNGDGMNDGFKVINYGNMTEYHLIIFNRWGNQVFETTDPGLHWNGTYNGIPCETGTYMYYFKGKCLTGTKVESKGDVILIR